jgi:hypothetical protein
MTIADQLSNNGSGAKYFLIFLKPVSAGTGSLDDTKLAKFAREGSFDTVLGQVRFGAGGVVGAQNIAGAISEHP